jgi:hypothetical protein
VTSENGSGGRAGASGCARRASEQVGGNQALATKLEQVLKLAA